MHEATSVLMADTSCHSDNRSSTRALRTYEAYPDFIGSANNSQKFAYHLDHIFVSSLRLHRSKPCEITHSIPICHNSNKPLHFQYKDYAPSNHFALEMDVSITRTY